MNRTDANSIALRSLRAILAATPSPTIEVAGKTVHLEAEPLPTIGWPRSEQGTSDTVVGLDESRDGPWPPAVRIACSWEGGGTILRAEASPWRNSNLASHHQASLVILAPGEVKLLRVIISNQLAEAKDGQTAPIITWASVRSRPGDPPGQSRKLNDQLLALLESSGLPTTSGPSMIEVCEVRIPDGSIDPSPREAFDRALHLALLQLPFMGWDKSVAEGTPLFVPDLSGPSPSWERPASVDAKRAGVYMLPGGVREYKKTLDELLGHLADGPMPIESFEQFFRERFGIGRKSPLGNYRSFLLATGLVALEGGTIRLTSSGTDYLIERDPVQLFEYLDTRFTGLLETLVITEKLGPSSLNETSDRLRSLLGVTWQTNMQPMIRRNWLLSLGLVSREADGDIVTELGRTILNGRAEDVAAIVTALDKAPLPSPTSEQEEPLAEERAVEATTRVDLTPDVVRPHLGKLRFPKRVLDSACAALSCGSHLLLVGPPGTGKTELAMALGQAAFAEGFCEGIRPSTASADWTTFETIGGYALEPTADGQALLFRPGVFLQAVEANQWLLIDELNRADVDRAFGELMTVLSGKTATLPYRDAGDRPISIGKDGEPGAPREGLSHPLPSSFRLIATMNTWDKTSLFRLSYALQRRFAILHVGLPDDESYAEILRSAAEAAEFEDPLPSEVTSRVLALFSRKGLLAHIDLGPAIGLEVVRYLRRRRGAPEAITEAFGLYVLPQLEGLGRQAALDVRSVLRNELGGWVPPAALQELEERFAELHPERYDFEAKG